MMMNRISSVSVVRYPVLLVTFEDGLSGEYDLTKLIEIGPMFEPLKDRSYFETVAVAPRGRSFGWNLDQEGREIDLCPDATRIEIETRMVDDLARQYEQQLIAAE